MQPALLGIRVVFFSIACLSAAAAETPPAYQTIQSLLTERCGGCHKPGEIGPMPLTSYAEVRPWAKAIKEAVLLRAMPPWFADQKVSERFRNDRSLNPEEIHKIVAWVDAGAPAGELGNIAVRPAGNYAAESPRTPDVVIKVPGMHVPASGTMEYTFLVKNLHFQEDKWIQGAEWRIDHREVVHHMNAYVRPPGSSYVATAPYDVPYVASKSERTARRADESENDRRELLIGYEPGYRPEVWGTGRAKLIRKGSDMVFEMHYTANGKAVVDSSELWLYFAEHPPKERVLSLQPSDRDLAIPPGDPNYHSFTAAKFTSAVTLISVQPHMHLRGKAYQMEAVYPDGRREILIRVPRYDFRWQTTYFLSNPLQLPKGTTIECSAWYDNSPNNPNNPDPEKTIRWGDQSWDEMNVGFLEVAFDAGNSAEVAVLSSNSTAPVVLPRH
jgi:copper type II ascorbate-dependent monooxygenase-like protein